MNKAFRSWRLTKSGSATTSYSWHKPARLLLITIVCQFIGGPASFAQTIYENSKKYNSSSAGMNHMILAHDYLAVGTPDALHYARQNFLFIVNMTGEDNLKPRAYIGLGTVDMMENAPESAVVNFSRAIQLAPDDPVAHFNLGAAYYKQSALQKAEQSFAKAVELDPRYGRAHYSLGFVYFDQKRYDLAKKQADKAAELGVTFKTLKERLAGVNPR